jgi:hypothetical protein
MSQSTHELWDNLRTTALLGTERQMNFAPTNDAALGSVLNQLDAGERESTLLSATATLSLYERAGQLPAQSTLTLPEPCAPETQRRCNERASWHLSLIINGEYRELLPEWLQLAGKANLRAPEELLPELLDAARRQSDLRPGVACVIGERGRWLAKLNPYWKYFAGQTGESDEATWQTGSTAARMEVLARCRETQPDVAREWLQSTWKEESPKDRAEFLRILQTGLSAADEPFLESALDDKSKAVREAAVELLSRLPSSALVARMIERVNPLLQWHSETKGRILRKTTHQLEVTLPDAFDESMARDGLEEKPAGTGHKGFGAKALRLRQMLSAVPPSHWSQSWNASPSEILHAIQGHEWEEMLRTGWRNAAQSFGDEAWLELLLQDMLARGAWNDTEILNHVSPARRETFVLGVLEAQENQVSGLYGLLQVCQGEWSESFGRRIIEALRTQITQAAQQEKFTYDAHYYGLHTLPKQIAPHLPPHLVDEFAAGWPTDAPQWSYWQKGIHDAVTLLEFRRDMRHELRT